MIISLKDFVSMEKSNGLGLICMTSMPADPIHPGHISCLQSMRETCKLYLPDDAKITLVCLVNDDNFLIKKKGFAFIPLEDRCEIINSISHGVDFVIPFSPSDKDDMTVNEGLKIIRPKFFCKGGDRVADETLPEWDTCLEINCRIIDRVGLSKRWSSSDYLNRYKEYILAQHDIFTCENK